MKIFTALRIFFKQFEFRNFKLSGLPPQSHQYKEKEQNVLFNRAQTKLWVWDPGFVAVLLAGGWHITDTFRTPFPNS